MILKALYDYYHRSGNLPASGMEEKEIGFLIVISKDGQFIRFEDCRVDNKSGRIFLVKKHVERSSAVVANYLYDNSAYVLGISDRKDLAKKEQKYFDTFKDKVASILNAFPYDPDLNAIVNFYKQGKETIREEISQDPLWEDIKKNLSKKFSTFSFRIEGETRIIAERREILQLDEEVNLNPSLCLITGSHGDLVDTTTATMIPGSQAKAKLVSFQTNSGYDSYGKTKCANAPISKEAEFAYTTALNTMLGKDSHNKFRVGDRTFVFWASSTGKASEQAEEGLFDLLGYSEETADDPNEKVEQVKKVFYAIYSGSLKTDLEDRFYILGLAPNSARIAVVYWSETPLRDFAGMILKHFEDMRIIDNRKEKKPYSGLKDMMSSVSVNGKQSDVTPNLPEAVIKSIFQGLPYPYTLFSSCINRLKAECGEQGGIRTGRIAILKAYLNRINDNNNKTISVMLDKNNTNQGYLCGRLFAVLENLQYAANKQDSIRSGYMSAAASTPASVYPTILKLSNNHYSKLAKDKKGLANFFDSQKSEILGMIQDFPNTLDLNDQGRFFLGYYHQKNHKEDKNENA